MPGPDVGVDLEPAGDRRLRRLVALGGQHPAPAERVEDERRADVAAVRVDDVTGPPVHLRGREPGGGPALLPQPPAQLRVVERGPAPREAESRAAVGSPEAHAGDLLPARRLDAHRAQPRRGRGARRGRALADLVAVEDEDVRPRPGQLPCRRQAGERGAADEHVGPLARGKGSAVLAAARRPAGHGAGRSAPAAARPRCQGDGVVREPRTSKPVRSMRSRTAS